MHADADISQPAALMGEPSRAIMLTALLDGRALPAGELARVAGISPATASQHLARLTAGGLVTVTRSGRHHYYQLRDDKIARAVESLQAIAPGRPIRSLRDARAGAALAFARRCYDHLAGELAIRLADTFTERVVIAPLASGEKGALLMPAHPLLSELGIALPVHAGGRRPLVRGCHDWTERRPHIAGYLGAVLMRTLIDQEWLAPSGTGRALRLSTHGRHHLAGLLDVPPDTLRPAS